jgi:hypothetical protein
MTPEEIAMIVAVGDSLRANPVSWNEIDEQQKNIVIEIMRPRPNFDAQQRSFLDRWWLLVNDEQLAEINESLPPHTVCAARLDGEGKKWLCADLFTDAVDEGSRLYSVLPMLLNLTLHYHEDEYWPVAGNDE